MLKELYRKTKRSAHITVALLLVLLLGSCGEDKRLFNGSYYVDESKLQDSEYQNMNLEMHFDYFYSDSVAGRLFLYHRNYYENENLVYNIISPKCESRFKYTAKLVSGAGENEHISDVVIEYDSLRNHYNFYFGKMLVEALSNDTLCIDARIDQATLALVHDGVYPSRYFGRWVADYMWVFALFAIIMCIPAIYYGMFIKHIIITAAIAFTFYNDWMLFLPCLLSYYLCYPMIYLRFIKPDTVSRISFIALIVGFVYSLYCLYVHDSFGTAFMYLFVWGFTSSIYSIFVMGDNFRRCPKCGRFTKRVDLGDRYYSAPKILDKVGYLSGTSELDGFFDKSKNRTNVHCFWCGRKIG